MVTNFSTLLRSVLAASALLLMTAGTPAWADPPGRVARMSFIRGDVSFQPGGSGEWVDATINRPLVSGDRLATDRNARVELEIGAGSIRIDERSTVSLLDINDRITQVELTDGTLNIDVRRLLEGQSYEVDTPTLAFVVSQPGQYRVDVAPNGDSTMVSVFDGNGDVYGENNASYRVRGRQSYRFNDTGLRDYQVLDLPRADDFDRFCQQRNDRYERAVSSRYVSDEVVGYADLDDYGSWSTVASYGSVWYPRGLRSDWAPYRDGHWAWIDPWGWSWIDDQPWGFAPSHYGRWAYINTRWGWVPGPRQLRPVYAPALVAFVGGNNWGISIGSNPVGWFPLGPRDVYRPWYDCSRDYFTRVNTRNTIINNITVVNVYNDYSRGRPSRDDYAYRRDQRAFTAVPGNVFAGAQPVGRSRLRLDEEAIGRGNVVNAVAITPVQASLAQRGTGRVHRPDPERFDRAVVARNAPPAQVLPFEQREAIIRDNGNRSPGMDKLRGRERSTVAADDRRIRVVDAENQATPRDIPVAANRVGTDRGGANRDERRVQGRAQMADPTDGTANAEPRGNVLPSTRYSPAMRNRQVDDNAREGRIEQRQQAAGQPDVPGLQRSQDAQRMRADAEQQRAGREQAQKASEQRARRVGPDATDPPERFQPQTERQQRDVTTERQADQQRRNDALEQRRAQKQEQQRVQQVDGIQLPAQQNSRQVERMQVQDQQRAEQADRVEAQQTQRNQQAERMQVQEQQRAEQADRVQAQQTQRAQQAERVQVQEQQRAEQADRVQTQQTQRAQQAERVQAQEQQRAEQANRYEAQQGQRQQEQQAREAQMQERQQEVQSRQAQQQAQMQERQQQAQQVQIQQQQQQQQQQQPQPQPAQDQRELRKQQKREQRDAKEEQQNR